MVVLTGWAGFYLGSMRSGISSLQPGLLETLLGIGAVSAGSARIESGDRAPPGREDAPHGESPHGGRPHRIGARDHVGMLAIIAGTLWLTRVANLDRPAGWLC